MLVSNLSTSNAKPDLLSIEEKNINKILNEIKSFNPKTSHQNILNTLQKTILNPTDLMTKNSEKNILAFKNIFTELQNMEFYKEHPSELKNIQKEITILLQKYYKKSSLKKDIIDIKNELKNFSPQKSPQKITKLIDNLIEKFSKISTTKVVQKKSSSSNSIRQTEDKIKENNIKTKTSDILSKELKTTIQSDVKDILNKLEKIDFYKNDPKTFQNLKDQLSNIIKDRPYFLPHSNKQIIQNLHKKAITLLNIKKDDLHIKELIKNIENILKENDTPSNIKSKLKSIEYNFEKIKIALSSKPNTKNILLSMQKDIKILQTNLKIIPKHKEFNTLIKDVISHFKTGKIKILNQNQIIKNIGNITKNIHKIILNLPKDEKYIPVKEELSKFHQDIQQIDLKQNIKNSGILFESKLLESVNEKNSPIQITKHDVKAILLTLKNDTGLQKHPQLQNSIENTLSQINAVQANALLGQNFTSYIPFAWNNLKDGYFSIAKLKKEDGFSCKIELDLSKQGKVDILMLFHQELLSMKMDIKDKKFENILKKESPLLQQSLKKLGFETSIFFTKKQQNSYTDETNFNNSLNMDIKA